MPELAKIQMVEASPLSWWGSSWPPSSIRYLPVQFLQRACRTSTRPCWCSWASAKAATSARRSSRSAQVPTNALSAAKRLVRVVTARRELGDRQFSTSRRPARACTRISATSRSDEPGERSSAGSLVARRTPYEPVPAGTSTTSHSRLPTRDGVGQLDRHGGLTGVANFSCESHALLATDAGMAISQPASSGTLGDW